MTLHVAQQRIVYRKCSHKEVARTRADNHTQYGCLMLLAMSNNRWLGRLAAPTTLLSLGIFVRLCTFLFLNPSNNDDHFNVIRLLVANGRLPLMTDTGQAYHPPLYYVMAAPLLAIFGTEKAVQSLSLILSIGTLVILYILVFTSGFVRGRTLAALQFFDGLLSSSICQVYTVRFE